MKIDRQKLLDSIIKVKPGLANKEIMQQSTSFVFSKGRMVTYNDRIMISHSVDIDFTGVVPSQEFYNLLNRCKDEFLDIDSDKDKIYINGKKFKAIIVLESKIHLPIDSVDISSKWNSLPSDFLGAIKFCNFSAGDNMSRPVLTNVYINKNVVQGCDSFRLMRCKIKNSKFKNLLIPRSSVKELVNYNATKYQISKNWIHFKTKDNTIFSCRLGEGSYPSMKPLLKFKGGNGVNFPKIIPEIIDRAIVLAQVDPSNSKFITVEVNKGKMIIKSNGPNGNFQESCNTDKHLKDFSFDIDPDFLIEILKYKTTVSLSKDAGKLRFHGDNFDYIISVMSG